MVIIEVNKNNTGKRMIHKTHSINELLDGIIVVESALNVVVKGLAIDTRKLVAGDVFVAVGGMSSAANALVPLAVAGGASIVLLACDDSSLHGAVEWEKGIPIISVFHLKQSVGLIWARFYKQSISGLPLSGVTGTNGKTSVTYFIAQMAFLLSGGVQGVIGTLGMGGLDELRGGTHTTPDMATIYKNLQKMKARGFAGVSMEVSSHALDQGRVSGLEFDVCVFTNLTRDHLDYHGSMENYGAAKKALFSANPQAWAVINVDDAFGAVLYRDLVIGGHSKLISYGIKNKDAQLQASSLSFDIEGVTGCVSYRGQEQAFSSNLVGAFNVHNLLAAVAVALTDDVSLSTVVGCIERIRPVPGRMEKVVCLPYKECVEIDSTEQQQASPRLAQQSPLVIVDYAHTPDALENALMALKLHAKAGVWCVFGCGGDRDKGKRPLMGQIAEKLADNIVVTTDNPRSEEPEAIANDILGGMNSRGKIQVELDRARAIFSTIQKIHADDVLLVAGKGHEDYQESNGTRIYFSDTECARQALSVRMGV